jgi:hypothetical protein
MTMPPETVVLRHPTRDLEVVVTVDMAAVLRRFGYTEVIEDSADELPDEESEDEADGEYDVH